MKFAVANNRCVNLEAYDTHAEAKRRVDMENEQCERMGNKSTFYYIKRVPDDYEPTKNKELRTIT